MLRLFRESLGLSGRKVGLGIKIWCWSTRASAFYTKIPPPPVCLRRDASPARLTGSPTCRPLDLAILSYLRSLDYVTL